MFDRLPFPSLARTLLIGLGLSAVAACTHEQIPANTDTPSGVTSNPSAPKYDMVNYTNTSSYDIPDNNLFAKMPSVQATLSQQSTGLYKGSKYQTSDMPPYILIDADEVNKWRYARVNAPQGTRQYFAPPMRLPISRTVPTGSYMVVRPVTQIFPTDDQGNRQGETAAAYLFKVLANANAETQSGNLLTLKTSVNAAKDKDWVVPIDYLDMSQSGMSSLMSPSRDIRVIGFAPESYYGSSAQLAMINGGTAQGISTGQTFRVQPQRRAGINSRAIRDGRDLRPEGIANAVVIQAGSNFSLARIEEFNAPVSVNDKMLPMQ